VRIKDARIIAAATLSHRYNLGPVPPDKAILTDASSSEMRRLSFDAT